LSDGLRKLPRNYIRLVVKKIRSSPFGGAILLFAAIAGIVITYVMLFPETNVLTGDKYIERQLMKAQGCKLSKEYKESKGFFEDVIHYAKNKDKKAIAMNNLAYIYSHRYLDLDGISPEFAALIEYKRASNLGNKYAVNNKLALLYNKDPELFPLIKDHRAELENAFEEYFNAFISLPDNVMLSESPIRYNELLEY